MPKVAIVTDSSTYLPKEYVDKYNIHVLPLTLSGVKKNIEMVLIFQHQSFI